MLDLKELSAQNRIIRSVALAALHNLEFLDKYAYRWLHVKSGFIAHYNRDGFIQHYGTPHELRQDILENAPMNLSIRGEKDVIYERIVNIITLKEDMPAKEECYQVPSITEYIESNTDILDGNHNEIHAMFYAAFANHFETGNYFMIGAHSTARIEDLAAAAEYILIRRLKEYDVEDILEFTNEDESFDPNFLNFRTDEFKFPSGNEGTINELFGMYRDCIYDVLIVTMREVILKYETNFLKIKNHE
jgi:hypothetical protein